MSTPCRCPTCGQIAPPGIERFDVETGILTNGRETVYLSPTLGRIAEKLLANRGRMVTRGALYEAMYWDRGEAGEPISKNVDVQLAQVRKKFATIGLEVKSFYERGVMVPLAAQRKADA